MWFFRHYRHIAHCERPLRMGETMRRYLVALTVGVFIACIAAGGATAKDLSLPRCDWVKAENSSSGVRVAQIDHCCVAARKRPDGTYDCPYAVNSLSGSCSSKLSRAGFPYIVFDGTTVDTCIDWILSTPWC